MRHWPMKRHSLYIVCSSARRQVCDHIWPDYPCLYDVRSVDFRNRDLLQKAMEAIGEQLDQTSISKIPCRFQYIIYLDYRFATEQMELRELKTFSNSIS